MVFMHLPVLPGGKWRTGARVQVALNTLRLATLAMICTAAVWDVLGEYGAVAAWWPVVSYVFAGAAVVTGCIAALGAVLTSRRALLAAGDAVVSRDVTREAAASEAAASEAAGSEAVASEAAAGEAAAGEAVARGAASAPAGSRTGGQLLAVGILLLAWLLRGHPEIPPDVPLIAAELVAAVFYAVFTRRART